MDRDHRWERTERAYTALTEVIENRAVSAEAAIEAAYAHNVTDEFIEPVIILDQNNNPYPRIASHDAVIFYNYRIDRPRQLTRAFVVPDFETHPTSAAFDPYAVKYHHKHVVEEVVRAPFIRRVVLPDLFFVTMTEYERNLPCVVAFPLQSVPMPIGKVFAEAGARQLRISETEKERFIGYYFNGMREDPFTGEDRLIIPSPRVATYDLQPEMSAYEITKRLIDRLTSDVYAFFVVNFANPDMVGHTGNIPAAIRACQVVDECVGTIAELTLSLGGTCVITADHGNVEEMLGANGEMDTEHSTFPVPLIMINEQFRGYPTPLPLGKLADVAPTILHIAGITPPSNMNGKNLLADLEIGRRS
jgi:2,3-bisphosphoglycerate-independent phosphoglycerate mutase